MHTIELDHLVLDPEEGLLLGNGDLSVSIYQKPGRLVWRFGKNDVWDRRLDLDAWPAASATRAGSAIPTSRAAARPPGAAPTRAG